MAQFYHSEEEITALIAAFRNKTLPPNEWTHHAHLTVGLWFSKHFSAFEALCYLRSGIITYNQSVGTENSPQKGYHETLTVFWHKVIDKFVAENTDLTLLELCNTFLNRDLVAKDWVFQFYSREVLFSIEARATWVQPDKASDAFF
ncbi:MAG: hypothetical protein EAZ08_01440 [Cytophagales bacterium]|nr:MAG: hypothetical protein EAZ08_01440 [Cytophagales bacterium]